MDKIIDNTDYTFEDNENILGIWEYVSYVDNIEDDINYKATSIIEPYLTSFAFLPNGDMRMETYYSGLNTTAFTWTKGHILNSVDGTCSGYTIYEDTDGVYLFVEWKNGDYVFNGATPKFYVLKKKESIIDE